MKKYYIGAFVVLGGIAVFTYGAVVVASAADCANEAAEASSPIG